LIIDVNSVNDAPYLIPGIRFEPVGYEDQEIHMAESALLKMFSDADGDVLTLDSSSLTTRFAGDKIRFDQVRRELVFAGAPNANGMREFSFKVTDSKLSSPMVTIGVMLRPVNDAPVVNAIGFQMLEDGGATDPTQSAWTYLPHTMLLSGATDAEGDALFISKVSAAQTTGTTTPRPVEIINDMANQRIGLRAPLNYNGPVVFEFTVSDGHGGETTQKAYGLVTPVNDVPYLTASRTSLFVMNWFVRFESTTWKIDAWDPDANQTVKIAVARNPLRGQVGIIGNSTTPDPRGGIMTTATVASFSGLGNRTTTETAWLSATDSVGASAQISISFTGRYSTDPIVIDLGRDGFSFIDIEQSRVSFTVHGVSRRSAWIGAGEGILAYDSDQGGRIQRLDEIAFGEHVGDPGLSDLQALQNLAFDQNQDGVFDNNDAKWSDFYLWQDLNGNGVSDPGELKRLADAGIRGLFLNANVLNRAEGVDVRVRGHTRVLMEDGRLLQAADVWLGLENPDRLNSATADPTMQQISLMGSDQFNDLLKQLANAPQQGNRAPLVYGQMPTQFADEGQPFRLDIAPNFFIDADTSDPLQIELRQANGSVLPDWLHWDASQLMLQGVPQYTDTGKLQLALIATDRQGASSQVSFTLVTASINRAPVLNQVPAYLGWQLNTSNQFEVSTTLFTDPNEDDILRYQVSMPYGTHLPAWLQFDQDSGLLTGTPSLDDLYRPIRLKVTATDRGGLSNSTVLTLVAATSGTDADDVLSGTVADDNL